MARQLQGPEADLVPVAPGRARQRRVAARKRASGVRRLALARVLDPAGNRDRVQARGLRSGAERTGAVPESGFPPRQTRCRSTLSAMIGLVSSAVLGVRLRAGGCLLYTSDAADDLL